MRIIAYTKRCTQQSGSHSVWTAVDAKEKRRGPGVSIDNKSVHTLQAQARDKQNLLTTRVDMMVVKQADLPNKSARVIKSSAKLSDLVTDTRCNNQRPQELARQA